MCPYARFTKNGGKYGKKFKIWYIFAAIMDDTNIVQKYFLTKIILLTGYFHNLKENPCALQ